MSGAIDRLRTARDGHHALAHVWPADLRDVLADLDAAEISGDHQRTRADAAEAECARLTTERDAARRAATFAEMERDTLRGLTDAMRADNVRLRAIVEGRTVPPTPQEIAAHHDASGSGWLVSSDRDVIPYTLCRSEARDGGAPDGARWWPLDASGRPCPWPTVAAEAATGAAR